MLMIFSFITNLDSNLLPYDPNCTLYNFTTDLLKRGLNTALIINNTPLSQLNFPNNEQQRVIECIKIKGIALENVFFAFPANGYPDPDFF